MSDDSHLHLPSSRPRIAVLTNRRAGRNEARIERVLREIERHPDVLHRETSSHTFVPEALLEFQSAGAEILVVNGGDGTVQHALTALLETLDGRWQPAIAPLRSGRTNMIALDLDGRRDPVRGLRDLITAARAGTVRERIIERPVLHMTLGSDRPRYGMFFGAGILYRAIDLIPDGKARGLAGGGVLTATLVARAAAGNRGGVLGPDKVQVAFEGASLAAEEFMLLMASTLQRLFLRMRPFWGREAAPIRFTAIEAGARGLARAVPGVLRGRPPAHATREAGYISHNTHELAVRLDCGVTLDGELFAPESDRVVTLRADERLRFLRA